MPESAVQKAVRTALDERGWHVVSVGESSHRPPYAYTLGLHRSHAHPEVLILGLPEELSRSLLDMIAVKVRAGQKYGTSEAYEDVLRGYLCRFRPVAQEAFDGFLGVAVEFYRGREFGVLQCIWPDAHQKFPWDEEYNPILQWKQPLLNDPATAKVVSAWSFVEPYNLGVFTTAKVLTGEPILMVTHDREDGGWRFLTGATEAPDQGRRVPLLELVRRDPTLNEIGDLPLGGMAVRDSRRDRWQRIE